MTDIDPRAEEREFYDGTDYAELDLERADDIQVVRHPLPRSTFAVRLDASTIEQLREAANRHGTRPTQLAREWLEERLERELAGEMVPRLDAWSLEHRIADVEMRLNYLSGSYPRGSALTPGHDVDVVAILEAHADVARTFMARLTAEVSVELSSDPGADLIVRNGTRTWVVQFKSGTVDLTPSFKHLVGLAERMNAQAVIISPGPPSEQIQKLAAASVIVVTSRFDVDQLVNDILQTRKARPKQSPVRTRKPAGRVRS